MQTLILTPKYIEGSILLEKRNQLKILSSFCFSPLTMCNTELRQKMSDSLPILVPMVLQHIKKMDTIGLQNSAVRSSGMKISTPPETRVLIEVEGISHTSCPRKLLDEKRSAAAKATTKEVDVTTGESLPARGGCEKSVIGFDCPVFILQYSSPRLGSMLSTAILAKLYGTCEENLTTGGSTLSSAASLGHEEMPELVRLRLPFPCDAETFETIALYVEHFYGIDSVSMLHSSSGDPSSNPPISEREGFTSESNPESGRNRGDAAMQTNNRSDSGYGSMHENTQGNYTPTFSTYRPIPTVFEPPLKFADLYHLQPWEVAFVWQRLLHMPSLLQARHAYSKQMRSTLRTHNNSVPKITDEEMAIEGSLSVPQLINHFYFQSRWVDALGAPKDTIVTSAFLTTKVTNAEGENDAEMDGGERIVSPTAPPTVDQMKKISGSARDSNGVVNETECHGEANTVATSSSVEFTPIPVNLFFTIPEKQQIAHRILSVLEASSQLQITPLQSLCAALMANMIIDLEESELRCILHPPKSSGEDQRNELLSSSPVPTSTTIASEDDFSERATPKGVDGDDSTFSYQQLPPLTDERKEELYQRYPWAKAAFGNARV